MRIFRSGIRAQLAGNPQPEKLVNVMYDEGMKHGDTARVDILNVRVGYPNGQGDLQTNGVYFCEIRGIKVRRVLAYGDGGDLPGDVKLSQFRVRRHGYVDLINVLLRSNGAIEVTLDPESEVVAAQPMQK